MPLRLARARGIVRDYAAVLLGVGVGRLLNLAAALFLAHTLTVAQFGQFSLGYAFAMLLGQLPTVLDVSFVRRYALSESASDESRVVRAFVYSKLVAAAVIAIGGVGLSYPLALGVFHRASLVPILQLAFLDAALFSLLATVATYFQATRRFGRFAAVYVLEGGLGVLVVGAYALMPSVTPVGGMVAWVVVDGLLAMVALGWLARRVHVRAGGPLGATAREIVATAGWLLPANVLYLVTQRVDLILLGAMVPLVLVGEYAGIQRLVAVVAILTGNLPIVFMPRAPEALDSRARRKEYFSQAALLTGLIMGAALVAAACAPALIAVFLGSAYVPATTSLRILLLTSGVIAIGSPLMSLAIGQGRTVLVFYQRAIELAGAVVGGLILVPRFGGSGAATAMLAAYAMGSAFIAANAYRMVRRRVAHERAEEEGETMGRLADGVGHQRVARPREMVVPVRDRGTPGPGHAERGG